MGTERSTEKKRKESKRDRLGEISTENFKTDRYTYIELGSYSSFRQFFLNFSFISFISWMTIVRLMIDMKYSHIFKKSDQWGHEQIEQGFLS